MNVRKSVVATVSAMLLLGGMAANAKNSGGYVKDVAEGSLKANHGMTLCTAAINSDGTVAGGQHVNKNNTARTSIGQYEVSFFKPCNDVRASEGFMRFVQIDALDDTFVVPAACITADRNGDKSAIYIFCSDFDGNPIDVSFFLQVSR